MCAGPAKSESGRSAGNSWYGTPRRTTLRSALHSSARRRRCRARILAGRHESSLYEPDLLDLADAVRHVHAEQTPATRTIQAAIRAALDGGADVEAKLEGDALRVLAQAIRGLEITQGLSPALQELAWTLNQHFDDLKKDVR